jgi:hypothetical protein
MKAATLTALAAFATALSSSPAAAYNNGMAKKPPLGWQTWCSAGPCGTDHCFDRQIRATAQAMVDNGMAAIGYEWIVLDDCWHPSRDANGTLVPFPDFFPDGMKPVIDYVHGLGLKFGLCVAANRCCCPTVVSTPCGSLSAVLCTGRSSCHLTRRCPHVPTQSLDSTCAPPHMHAHADVTLPKLCTLLTVQACCDCHAEAVDRCAPTMNWPPPNKLHVRGRRDVPRRLVAGQLRALHGGRRPLRGVGRGLRQGKSPP